MQTDAKEQKQIQKENKQTNKQIGQQKRTAQHQQETSDTVFVFKNIVLF